MKNIFIYSLLITFSIVGFSQNKKNEASAKIDHVTVFLNRAQINSIVKTNIGSGYSDIIIQDLPNVILPQSIQLKGKGNFSIMGVRHSPNFIDETAFSENAQRIKDSLELIKNNITEFTTLKEVYTKEEQLLYANQSIKGDNNNVTPEAIKSMADFYRKRLTEVKFEIIKLDKKLQAQYLIKSKLDKQLNHLNRGRNSNTSQIIVTVNAKQSTNVILELDYIVNNAGWTPIYDLRAKDTKTPVDMTYKAKVFQNTGYDWDNVKLTLSTMNPSLSGNKPDLATWRLNIYTPYNYKSKAISYDKYEKRAAPSRALEDKEFTESDEFDDGWANMPEATTVANITTTSETTLATEFEIALPYSVNSGPDGQVVDVMFAELPADFIYYAVPKLDKDAFLMARVVGWEKYNMISGEANIYFEGSFVGNTFLDMASTKDTINLSLGRDKKIVVERKNNTDYTSSKFIGTNRKETFGYDITVRNTKKEPINIIIEDQYPISSNSLIEVEKIDHDKGELNESTGMIKWTMEIKPAETKKVGLKFSVKYPKNKRIKGL